MWRTPTRWNIPTSPTPDGMRYRTVIVALIGLSSGALAADIAFSFEAEPCELTLAATLQRQVLGHAIELLFCAADSGLQPIGSPVGFAVIIELTGMLSKHDTRQTKLLRQRDRPINCHIAAAVRQLRMHVLVDQIQRRRHHQLMSLRRNRTVAEHDLQDRKR